MKETQTAVAQAIRLERIRQGITSEAELARRAGLSPSALSKRLNGDLRMDLTDIEDIAAALGVDPLDLMGSARSERDSGRGAA